MKASDPRRPKTEEEIAEGLFQMYKKLRQYREKLVTGEISEFDLREQANVRAKEIIQERMEVLQSDNIDIRQASKDDQLYREDQETKYREAYDWNTANDERTLQHILDVEVNIRQVKRELNRTKGLSAKERDMLYDRHTKLALAHRDLLNAAGIDRLSREKRRQSSDPMEDWTETKRLAKAKLAELEGELADQLEKVETEAELRDRLKFHLAYPFSVIDPILTAHRRILGRPLEVEKS